MIIRGAQAGSVPWKGLSPRLPGGFPVLKNPQKTAAASLCSDGNNQLLSSYSTVTPSWALKYGLCVQCVFSPSQVLFLLLLLEELWEEEDSSTKGP